MGTVQGAMANMLKMLPHSKINQHKKTSLPVSRRFFLPAAILLFTAWIAAGQTSTEFRYKDPSLPLEVRVNDLVGRMTIEEKISQMMNAAPAIDRLEIPEYEWWNECLHGVGRAGLATVKHYVVHSGPEPERHSFNAFTDERDLWDTYMPQFEMGIKEGRHIR